MSRSTDSRVGAPSSNMRCGGRWGFCLHAQTAQLDRLYTTTTDNDTVTCINHTNIKHDPTESLQPTCSGRRRMKGRVEDGKSKTGEVDSAPMGMIPPHELEM